MAFSIDWESWIGPVVAIGIALIAALVVIVVTHLVAALVGRAAPWALELDRRVRAPWGVVVGVVAVWIGCAISLAPVLGWWPGISRVFLILTIIAGAWLLASLASFGFEQLMAKENSLADGAAARRRRTQLVVIHRLSLVIIAVLALGTVLFTFPEMRAVGASVLASAGIVSIIAGLAAQSILGNLIAGIQIAFTDAIRVGDVVVIEGEWGRIGEINLSYVVVYIWDERRLVLPCSYFTSTPFETWTRKSDQVLGTVYMDLDWRVPMDAVRARFTEIIEASDAWDRRTANVKVTGSEGGFVTVRFVISAKDSDDQWTLRCDVREQMMTWLQQEHPEALPRTRVLMEQNAR
ncbi:mechanosensitive ion channel family protein [Microbacterium sp. NPDC058342]|uniref:mechanosensitive ion channel family protein n=1 Tax=Microbacterium sp. NPDC058342 TaxID=3346454 RepID=UPI0036592CD4